EVEPGAEIVVEIEIRLVVLPLLLGERLPGEAVTLLVVRFAMPGEAFVNHIMHHREAQRDATFILGNMMGQRIILHLNLLGQTKDAAPDEPRAAADDGENREDDTPRSTIPSGAHGQDLRRSPSACAD